MNLDSPVRVAILALVVMIIWLVSSRWRSLFTSKNPRRADDFIVALSFGSNITNALRQSLSSLDSLAPHDRLREAMQSFARAMGSSTHCWIGPTPGDPNVLRWGMDATADLSTRFVSVMHIRLNATVELPNDFSNATEVQGFLQRVASGSARAVTATTAFYSPDEHRADITLAPVTESTLPGHVPCAFCGTSRPARVAKCTSCGASS